MAIQIIGIVIAILGILSEAKTAFFIGGFILVAMDLYAFFTGQLNPLVPIILYIIGYTAVENWTGILWGALVGNILEVVGAIFHIGILPKEK